MKVQTATAALGLIGLLLGVPWASAQERGPVPPPARPSAQDLENARQEPTGGTPRMELSSTEWDFGVKWYGEPCSAEITIASNSAIWLAQ